MYKSKWQMIIAYLVIGGIIYAGIYYYYSGKDGYNSSMTPSSIATPVASATTSLPSTASSPMAAGLEYKVALISSGYAPASLTIAVGDTVTWTNNSDKPATVNSDPHPKHSDYSPLNLGMIKPGSSVSLKFNTAGSYSYHNHLNADQRGTIIVK